MTMAGGKSAPAKRVMIVADPTRESAAALQYALSHAIYGHDTLILLHVGNTNAWGSLVSILKWPLTFASGVVELGGGGGEMDFLQAMKRACEIAQPKLRVQIEKVEIGAKDKAVVILQQTTLQSVDLLIVGQRWSLSNLLLGHRKNGSSLRGPDTTEYLIENSKCTCVAVQKKGQNGGYVLNTKTQKGFWVLA